MTQLGDDAAGALGVRVERTRLIVIVAAVGLIAFATAAAGPIAFVAFLSGPIAARFVGGSAPLLIPSALVGALLVLTADLCGQYAVLAALPRRRRHRRARRARISCTSSSAPTAPEAACDRYPPRSRSTTCSSATATGS